jgi:uncharacterized phage protein gp47/JayE
MFSVPSLTEIKDRIVSSVQNSTGIIDNKQLQHSFFGGLISGMATTIDTWYKTILNTVTVYIITKAMKGQWLDAFGNYLRLQRKPATQSTGIVNIQGNLNTIIPINTFFSIVNSGQYKTLFENKIENITLSISNITAVNNIATVITTNPHNLATNNKINITGCLDNNFNVTNVSIAVINENTFTYNFINTLNAINTTGGTANLNIAFLQLQSVSTGTNTNLSNGTGLTLLNTIAGLENIGYVNFYGISGGTNQENDNNYRNRIDYKLFNNTQNYTYTGVQQYLLQKYSKITRVKILQNYIESKQIKSITNWDTDNDFKVIEFFLPHNIINPMPFHQIVGSSIPGLNQYNGFVIKIIDNVKILIYNPVNNEDTTSVNMQYIPYQYGFNTLMFLKDNDLNIYPNNTDINEVSQDLIDNVMPWTDSLDTFIVKAPRKQEVKFQFSSITPNSVAMQTAIKNNLVDYFRVYKNIGDKTKANEYNSVLYRTIDANGNKLNDFIVDVIVNNVNGIADITPTKNEISDVNINNITFA